jgi:hypothetical protein
VPETQITFDGDIASGVPFSSLGKGVEAWDKVPDNGKAQILLAMGAIELASEAVQRGAGVRSRSGSARASRTKEPPRRASTPPRPGRTT